jgi:hypothetical protein
MSLELVNRLPYDHPYRWDGTLFGGPKLWRPSDLGTSLALWLDAEDTASITLNGSNVSQWNDKSGNARHATQGVATSQPAFNAIGLGGKPVITFDGTDDSLRISIPNSVIANTTHGIYYVFARKGAGTGADAYRPEISSTTSTFNADRGAYHYIKTSNNLGASYPYYAGGGPSSNNYDLTSGIAYANDVRTIIALQGNTTGWGVWRTGVLEGTTAALVTPHSSIAGLVIGHQPFPSRFSNIEVVEVLLVNDVSTSTRQLIEGYLAHKWGLEANLPISHPYRLTPPYAGEPVYDPDAQTYFNRVEGSTGDNQKLEAAVKAAINDFVVGCKADGIWNAIKSSCILAGARTLAGALQPLVGTAPTNFNFVSGDYDRKTGLKASGTKTLDSNRSVNTDPQDNRHASVYVTTATTSTSNFPVYIGSSNSPATQIFRFNANAGIGTRCSSVGATTLPSSGGSTGLLGVTRSSSSQYTARKDNTSTAISVISANNSASNYVLFAGDNNGRLAFYSIGESLDLALLDARVTTLINNIAFFINTGLNHVNYDADTIAYVNAGYAAGGTLA